MSNQSPTNPPQDAEDLRLGLQLIFFPSPIPTVLNKDAQIVLDKAMQLIEAYAEAQRVSARDEALLEAGWIRCDYCSEVKLSCSHTYSADGKVTGHICKECKEKQREQ